MKKNADAKHEEIQSGMVETNKRRKQIATQLKQKEEELEELKRVCLYFFFELLIRLLSVFSYRPCLFAGSCEKSKRNRRMRSENQSLPE